MGGMTDGENISHMDKGQLMSFIYNSTLNFKNAKNLNFKNKLKLHVYTHIYMLA